jgi:hypothetical protein
MKVKIVKCSDKSFWYEPHIGKEIEIRDCNSLGQFDTDITDRYSCLDFYKTGNGDLVLKKDVEEIKSYDFTKPNHYKLWPDMKEFELHKKLLSKEEYIGFLKGNILKYQMRLGKKPNEPIERDQDKIKIYTEELNAVLHGRTN